MLKPMAYAIFACLVAGSMLGGPAVADNHMKSPSTTRSADNPEPNEPKGRYDTERNCAEVDAPKAGAARDNPEPNEPNARYDAARDCISTDADRRPRVDNPEANEPGQRPNR